MKKTTIISITIIIIGICSLNSCRENDIDLGEKNINLPVEVHQTGKHIKNGNDSVSINDFSNSEEDDITLIDPPPKDRGQW